MRELSFNEMYLVSGGEGPDDDGAPSEAMRAAAVGVTIVLALAGGPITAGVGLGALIIHFALWACD